VTAEVPANDAAAAVTEEVPANDAAAQLNECSLYNMVVGWIEVMDCDERRKALKLLRVGVERYVREEMRKGLSDSTDWRVYVSLRSAFVDKEGVIGIEVVMRIWSYCQGKESLPIKNGVYYLYPDDSLTGPELWKGADAGAETDEGWEEDSEDEDSKKEYLRSTPPLQLGYSPSNPQY
jgi:hypothetical protein